MANKLRGTLLTLLTTMSLLGCATPVFWSSDEISGYIVDAETGRQIEAAIVVAKWKLDRPRLFHGTDDKELMVEETMTDSSGRFVLLGWGPRYGGITWNMSGGSPYGYILKEGYLPEVIANYSRAFGGYPPPPDGKFAEITKGIPHHAKSPIVASWNGAYIKLKSVTDLKNYAWRLSLLGNEFYLCCQGIDWKKMPHAVAFIDHERKRLRSLGVSENDLAGMIDLDRFSLEDRKFIEKKTSSSTR